MRSLRAQDPAVHTCGSAKSAARRSTALRTAACWLAAPPMSHCTSGLACSSWLWAARCKNAATASTKTA